MIYQENNATEDILPPIKVDPKEKRGRTEVYTPNKNSQTENKSEQPYKITLTDTNNYNNNYSTIVSNRIINNRYNIKDINETDINKDNQYTSQTITNSRNITDNNLDVVNNPYTAKVELENVRSTKDCIFLLEQYLKTKNKQCHYETFSDQDKLIFSFDDEKIAFDFTKIIYNEKIKNILYRNVLVQLRLSPNQKYIKLQNSEKKKRGISFESIMKLYNGSSFKKREKELPRINGNLNFGLKSPFYSINNSRRNNFNSMRSLKDKNHKNRVLEDIKNRGDINGYVGYDGLPLKNYEKLKISVLDTHYKPLYNFKYRQDDKRKWVSPANFKSY